METVSHRLGFSYIAVLLFVTVLSVLGLGFLSRSGVETSAALNRGEETQAEYLAEAAAGHAMWSLLHDSGFPPAEDRYYMHSLGAGRYGYMVRRHTSSTFAAVAAVGAVGESVVHRSYVLNVTSPAPTGLVISGAYTGNGVDNRAISGVGFQPDVMILKSQTSYYAVIRTSTMSGDLAKPMTGNNAAASNLIQSLNADGFTVGSSTTVNRNGFEHYWAAFRAYPGVMEVGTYVGNGVSGRSFTGMSFSPALVIVFGQSNTQAVHKSTAAAQSYNFAATAALANCILDPLLADGFRVGNDARVNTSGQRYHYVCWPQIAGDQVFGSYTGNGADNRNMTGLGLAPEYVVIRCVSEAQNAVHRTESLSGDATMYFSATANVTNRIQALLPDGFQLGSANQVNRNARLYAYYAWKER